MLQAKNPFLLPDTLMNASSTIWAWREDAHQTSRASTLHKLRKTGIIRALIGAVIGAVIYGLLIYFERAPTIAYIAWSLSGVVLVAAVVSPGWAYKGIEKAVGRFAVWVGTGVTVLLLTPIYFLVFMPFRFLFRTGTRDRLLREFPGGADSYWVQRSGKSVDPEYYRRQFS